MQPMESSPLLCYSPVIFVRDTVTPFPIVRDTMAANLVDIWAYPLKFFPFHIPYCNPELLLLTVFSKNVGSAERYGYPLVLKWISEYFL